MSQNGRKMAKRLHNAAKKFDWVMNIRGVVENDLKWVMIPIRMKAEEMKIAKK